MNTLESEPKPEPDHSPPSATSSESTAVTGEFKGGLRRAVRQALLCATFAVVVCGSFIAGARYGQSFFAWMNLNGVAASQPLPGLESSTEPSSVAPTFSLFWEAWNVVTHNFVDQQALNVQEMTWGAIDGMVNSLGDTGHSRFLTPSAYQKEQSGLQGRFSGIGAEVGIKNGQPVVIAPLLGSPAEKAGLKAGDVILKVDNQDASRMSVTDLTNSIRGPAGTKVTLTVMRSGRSVPLQIVISRASVTADPVSYVIVPGTEVADVRLSQFSPNAGSELKAVLQSAQSEHAVGIVLDLRDDPGGILNQAVDVASQFMKGGTTVVVVQSRSGQQNRLYAQSGGVATSLPLTVLVNKGTASAAEIVAGALKDNHRADVVGETTFGTGTVLSTFRLKDGSAILLGTSEWLTPNGQTIKDQGIQPNIPVPLPDQTEELTPNRARNMSASEIEASGDSQFKAALQNIKDRAQAPAPAVAPRG